MAGTISSAVEGPDPAFAARIGQSVANAPSRIEAHAPIPAAAVPAPAAPAPPAAGAWQVQVGAFRDARAAEAHLRALESQVPELAKLAATHQLRGKIDRIRIGGIGGETAARQLCSRILAAGSGCFVVRPES